ncbi:hypothetical protein [Streptomyces griseocarneus]|uniref:hypothetical protein n=1 Tax=Streptomyces griseocarneus TaxID=51201 RepID=UPI00167E1761|nr:hypothetical protein [Streptomyces griseocarneus]MBZ6476418.1 hypothetical protein [Streptomyces griseocarneus]GHG79038.1 hypothetical protein GCM10018779_59570 [Streptomyces griseocarneus]
MAEVAPAEQIPLFDFMVIRSPDELSGRQLRRHYVHDRGLAAPPTMSTHGPAVRGLVAVSKVTEIIFDKVMVWDGEPADSAALPHLRATLLAAGEPLGIVRRRGRASQAGPSLPTPALGELEAGAYLTGDDGDYYLLPERLDRLQPAWLFARLTEAAHVIEAHSRATDEKRFDSSQLRKELANALGRTVEKFVFGTDSLQEHWGRAHRILFDTLYLLYVMRRWTMVNLEPVTAALRTLHAIEALAADAVVALASSPGKGKPPPELTAEQEQMLQALVTSWPELTKWQRKGQPPNFPLISAVGDLQEHLLAVPVIHRLFAQLFWYCRPPFNDIKPIGIGDLKVVRQWLTAYRPGEISHIHNIMEGESRGRDHRRLEKTEETFSFTTSRTEDTSKDTQSTERFEVKAEAEHVLRDSLSVNASANVTASTTTPVHVTASAGFGVAYSRASEDHEKAAQNFARDVVEKAVSRVEARAASVRSTTKIFETEEKNSQIFDNKKGEGHVSGIYRWVDKEYTAQVFSYGRRMMFEFVVPEPAAFWVTARLRSYESELAVPQPPDPPKPDEVNLKLTPDQITEAVFKELQKKYDLSGFTYPTSKRKVVFQSPGSQGTYFRESSVKSAGNFHGKIYECETEGVAGYEIDDLRIDGRIDYTEGKKSQFFRLIINGMKCYTYDTGDAPLTSFDFPDFYQDGTSAPKPDPGPLVLDRDGLTIAFSFRWAESYALSISATLKRTESAVSDWQRRVFDTILAVERRRVDAINAERKLAYDARLAEYRNRLAQLDAVTVAEALRGGSEAANRAVISEELKKHCLTMITKEFDQQGSDDVLSRNSAMGSRKVKADSTRFTITEDNPEVPRTTAEFKPLNPPREVAYPAIDLDKARKKGLIVQFLEQAFEWEKISYIFYPYFWAAEPRWIDLMNRADDADPTFTAFLRAGMARVLVSVTPKYDCAVQHYLDTREPWSGGDFSPVIGSQLFIPLYEEIRQQQDDRRGGKPVSKPWTFTVPTSLVYLHGSDTPLPDLKAERENS